MTKYRTIDGTTFEATDATSAVRELHARSRSPCPSDADFRREMAKRALVQTGYRVRDATDDEFLTDLIQVGLVTEEG